MTYLEKFEHEGENLLDIFLQMFVRRNPMNYLQQQLPQLLKKTQKNEAIQLNTIENFQKYFWQFLFLKNAQYYDCHIIK